MRIAALDQAATKRGLFVGQSLSDARAIAPDLEVREIDTAYLCQSFADFADWHSNASPIVTVLADMAPYGDLVLDITGVTHLFGGESAMLSTLINRLELLGFTVAGAIAPTVGAAWAMAHHSTGDIIAEGEVEDALVSLPVASLRIGDECVTALTQMGLKRVGQLFERDRKSLTARFGGHLIGRLDQALGTIEERIVPRIPIVERYAERRFAEPIGFIDDVLMTANDLAIQLKFRLEAESAGAQAFHLFLYRVDHKVMSLSVNSARAIRDPHHITSLFRNRIERLVGEYDAGFGIDMIRLGASSVSQLDPQQKSVFADGADTADLDRLYDRMTSRLGPLAVVRPKFVNTHFPEREVRLEPLVARTADDPAAFPDPKLPRPLRLLPNPEQIVVSLAEVPDGPPPNMVWRRVVYRFIKVSGPERIGEEWDGPEFKLVVPLPADAAEKPTPAKKSSRYSFEEEEEGEERRYIVHSRDYYIAEDWGGRRFWLFREGLYEETEKPRWFIHGFFP